MFSQMREDIASVFERDPAARSTWEVVTCYPGLHAVWLHRIAHWCWRVGLKWAGRLVSHLSRWFTGIEIHPAVVIGRRVFIDHGMGVVIGETAEIGDDCTIYQGVTLGGTSLFRGAKRHPTLGKRVVVSAGAKVLGGFTVGDDAKVGSNAVVLKAVPPGATVVGVPGRIVEGSEKSPDKAQFAAYGVVPNQEDPYLRTLQSLVDHAQDLEQTVSALSEQMRRLEQRLAEQAQDPKSDALRAVK